MQNVFAAIPAARLKNKIFGVNVARAEAIGARKSFRALKRFLSASALFGKYFHIRLITIAAYTGFYHGT